MMAARAGSLVPLLVLAAALFGFVRPATAQVRTDELVRLCSGEATPAELGKGLCRMYISGLTDMHFHMTYELGQRLYCLTGESVSTDHVIAVYLDWVKRNPSEQYQSARYTMIRALSEGFPCE